MGFGAKSEWTGYPFDCHDYQSTRDLFLEIFLKTSHPSQVFIKTISSKFPFIYFLAGFLACGHPYGGYGIMKQNVFKVYPVSSPRHLFQIPFISNSLPW